jgi:lipase chaperone LimK
MSFLQRHLKWIGAMALAIAVLVALAWPSDEPARPTAPAAAANPFPFVRSLAGTTPDADLKVDAADALVVDAALGRLFDYYLSAQGEKTLPAIRAEIEAELGRLLKPSAAAEARRLLGRYLDYKQALAGAEIAMQKGTSPAHAARARLTAMQKLRSQFFSAAESAGLFGFDDAYNADAVARMEISQDQRLSSAQKAAQLAALDAALPAPLREARDAPQQVIKLEESVAQLRANGGSDDDVYRLRASKLTPEAAARFSDLDKEEATWKQRIDQYLNARNNLLAQPAVSETERQATLTQLRETRFTPAELPRLVAYER